MNKPYITKLIWIIEGIGYVITLAALGYAIYFACTNTDEIPTHYDFAGNIDGYGPASTILLLPIIMFSVNLLLSLSLHVLPDRFWSIPRKAEGMTRFHILYDIALMVALMILEMSIFTLVGTLSFTQSGIVMLVASTYLTVVTILTAVIMMIKIYREP